MKISGLFITTFLALAFFSCEQKKAGHVIITPDDSFAQQWTNQVQYEDAQDYVKNLDYDYLQHPEAHPTLKGLLSVIRKIAEGGNLEVIPDIQLALDSIKNDVIRQLYLDFVYEVLVDAGRFRAAVENFPQYDRKDVIAFSRFPEEHYQENQAQPPTQRMQKADFGYFSLQTEVNGTSAMGYFDTGSEISHMSRSFAKKIGLHFDESDPITVYTANSIDVYGYPAFIEELTIDKVTVKNHPVLVFEDETVTIDHRGEYVKLDFTLGWPLIKYLKFELDFVDMTYTAEVSQNTNTGFRNFIWFGYAGLKLNSSTGQSLIFGLDTGAKRTELRSNSLNKMNFKNLKDTTVEVGGLGGVENVEVKLASEVSLFLSSQRLLFESLEIHDGQDLLFISQDGTIGADIFDNNQITLDYQNGVFDITQR